MTWIGPCGDLTICWITLCYSGLIKICWLGLTVWTWLCKNLCSPWFCTCTTLTWLKSLFWTLTPDAPKIWAGWDTIADCIGCCTTWIGCWATWIGWYTGKLLCIVCALW